MVTTPKGLPHQLFHSVFSAFRLRTIFLGLCCFALCLSQSMPARGRAKPDGPDKPYALIFGTVWGPDNLPVYGVTVKIRRANEKKTRWELYSDHQGEFAQRVPAGKVDYVVWADVKGFKLADGKHLQPGEPVQVHVEYDERVDIGVHLK